MRVIGVDNDMRKKFFGDEASTEWNRMQLEDEFPDFLHYSLDIRSEQEMGGLFGEYEKEINLVIHAAAQPSHDWAAKDPITDFSVNANGTLVLLEMVRKFCPKRSSSTCPRIKFMEILLTIFLLKNLKQDGN